MNPPIRMFLPRGHSLRNKIVETYSHNFLKKFDFFKIIIYLYIEIKKRTKNNKVMMSINKHMNIWSDGFKGYCGNSYALAGTDVRFDERPSITEVEYVVRD